MGSTIAEGASDNLLSSELSAPDEFAEENFALLGGGTITEFYVLLFARESNQQISPFTGRVKISYFYAVIMYC